MEKAAKDSSYTISIFHALEFVSSLFISFHPSKTVGQEVESSNLLEFSNGKHLKLLFRF